MMVWHVIRPGRRVVTVELAVVVIVELALLETEVVTVEETDVVADELAVDVCVDTSQESKLPCSVASITRFRRLAPAEQSAADLAKR